MKGGVYPNRQGRGAPWVARFGGLTRRFKDQQEAWDWIWTWRLKKKEGTFDERDYRKDKPLGFTTLSDLWLDRRKGEVKSFRNIRNHIIQAQAVFGQVNVKHIRFADLDDFAQTLKGRNLATASQHHILATLHAFFVWASKREGIPVPEFPVIRVSLGWRNTVDKPTQAAIIDEVKRIVPNPKIWVGVKWLATYYEIRPIELLHIRERDINHDTGSMSVWYSKTDIPKVVYLLDCDVALAKSFGPAFPDLYFFRHTTGNNKAKPGDKFGPKVLWRWWKRACDNLGIKDVDLYGGTRHSTVRDLAKQYSPEQIMHGGWQTSKAFLRYLGPVQQDQKRTMYAHASGDTEVITLLERKRKRNPS